MVKLSDNVTKLRDDVSEDALEEINSWLNRFILLMGFVGFFAVILTSSLQYNAWWWPIPLSAMILSFALALFWLAEYIIDSVIEWTIQDSDQDEVAPTKPRPARFD